MFYLVATPSCDIIDCVDGLKETYQMILRNLTRICKGAVVRLSGWEYVESEGNYFVKKDNHIQLRKYYWAEGYLYNTMMYEDIGEYVVTEYEKKKVVGIKQGIICTNLRKTKSK